MHLPDHRLVFIGGLHRSGTTPLARCLTDHPDISGFRDTGVKEDEGQHLQSVYPTARDHGGPGRFATADAAHLTEESPLATEEHAELLLQQWGAHWDTTRPVLLEKSPPNLLMTRFLQSLYPEARFLVIVRHPVIVTLSTRKWAGGSLTSLLDHWFHAHDVFSADARHLQQLHVVKYEELIADPRSSLTAIARFLDLPDGIPDDGIERNRSVGYEKEWARLSQSPRPWERRTYRALCREYESRAQAYGYSLNDLDYCAQFPLQHSAD